jgi:DNA-binding XRE family transcriptional regulator
MAGTSKVRPPANALAKLREDASLSAAAAAESLNIAEVDLAAIEGGTAPAPTTLLANMARLYHASPHVVVKAYLADQR